MIRTATAILMAWICIAWAKAQTASCDSAFFALADTLLCPTDPVQTPDTIYPANGYFAASPGLSVDSLGTLDPGASSPGLHDLHYIVLDSCADTFTVAVEILPPGNASFAYPDTLYCLPGPDPLPFILGDSGGVFRPSGSLVLDSITGQLFLGQSATGLHSVTYITDSLCPDTTTFSLTLANTGDAAFVYPDTGYCTGGQDPGPVVIGDLGGSFTAPSGLMVAQGSGAVDLSQSAPGTYPVTYTTSGLCPDTVQFALTITQSQNPNFSYPSPLCEGDTNPLPLTTVPGGRFVALSAGLVLASTATGEIDLNTTPSGSYQVRYVTPGPCPDSTVNVVVVTGRNPAGFYYPDTTYCNGTPFAAPVVTGQGGGVFFSNDSLVIVDSLSGFINLGASQTGFYTINYASPGTCPDTSSFVLEIAPQGVSDFNYIPGNYCISDPDPAPTITGDTNGYFTAVYGGAVVDSFSGVIDLGASLPGDSILIQYTVPGIAGFCPDSSINRVRIFAPDSTVSVNYPKAAYCPDETDPGPTVTGQTGGTFQASPPGLAISQFTGEVDLSASQPGTYNVRYFPPGACTDTLNGFTITVNSRDVVSVGYPGDEFCTGAGMVAPLGISDSLGTFIEPTGFLVFDNPAWGGIDLDSSRAGAYLVRYTSGGACPEDTVLSLNIYQSPDALLMTNPEEMTICQGESMDFLGFGGDQFAFARNDSMVRGFQYNNLFQPGFPLANGDRFTLTVRNDLGGCTDRDSITLSVRPAPSLTYLDYDSIITDGEVFQVQFQADLDSVGVDWWFVAGGRVQPASDSGSTPVLRAGSFWQEELQLSLETTNEVGGLAYFMRPRVGACKGETDSLQVLILPESEIFIPQVMTPNGDGANDVWEIRHKSTVKENQWIISVFNRSGGEVWTQEGLAPVWNGGSNPDGVYWYKVENIRTGEILTGGLTIKRK